MWRRMLMIRLSSPAPGSITVATRRRLEAEHEELLAQVDAMQAALRCNASGLRDELGPRFERFLERLARHEELEQELEPGD